MFAFRGFLNILKPVFQNNNFLVIYSVIHYKGFYFAEFLVMKYLKKPWTQTPLEICLGLCLVITQKFGYNKSHFIYQSRILQIVKFNFQKGSCMETCTLTLHLSQNYGLVVYLTICLFVQSCFSEHIASTFATSTVWNANFFNLKLYL